MLLLKLRSRNRPWSGPASQPGNVWTLRATSAVGPDVVNATTSSAPNTSTPSATLSGERVQRDSGPAQVQPRAEREARDGNRRVPWPGAGTGYGPRGKHDGRVGGTRLRSHVLKILPA